MHTLAERIEVLLRQDRGGHQHSHLHAILYCFEGSADSDLCFAVTDIAADQAVHDPAALHIALRIFDRRQLVLGLVIREHFLQLALPDGVFFKGMSLLRLARRIELHQILRHFVDRALDLAPRIGPLLRTELVEFGPGRRAGTVFLQYAKLRGQHIQYAATAVLDLDIVLGDVVDFDLLNAFVNADPVVLVYDIVADLELRKGLDLLAVVFFFFSLRTCCAPKISDSAITANFTAEYSNPCEILPRQVMISPGFISRSGFSL